MFTKEPQPEQPTKPHIHCPVCLGSILEVKAQEYYYLDTSPKCYSNNIFHCSQCSKVYKREGIGKIERVFKDNRNKE